MPALTDLQLWNDPTAHSGEENMAIDELLLRSISTLPLLRIYRWSMPSVSFGYFETLEAAKTSFPENDQPLNYIRRWTGGGIVDHRIDLTYTLIIPKSHPMASLRGAESYRIIHEAVAAALNDQGVTCKLTPTDTGDGAAACFANPVAYDIITPDGTKLAGAGQKRSRYGLLHQGSVIGINDKTQWKKDFTKHLTEASRTWRPDPELILEAQQLGREKYATQAWLAKR